MLNYHGAPLPDYRGAANYFWLLLNKAPSFHGTFHYVETSLDTGEVVMRTREVEIQPDTSVFDLWMLSIEVGAKY